MANLAKVEKSSKIGQEKKCFVPTLRVFDCYCQFLRSGGETGRRAMSPHKFEIIPVFLNFLRS